MRHRLLDKPIPALAAFIAVAALGTFMTALIVRTINTAEFIAGQYATVDSL